ncbi:DUF6624 domain-containing protein [Sphingobacterium anhuiense]|uniref:DUF6624 domain-containing protein n=1 Tax=Sphingobacterium anhuiense TaxID=493780 RepID=A0ABW5YVN4_9SPHI
MDKKIIFLVASYILGSSDLFAQVTSFDIDSTKFKKEVALELDSIFFKDQEYRKQYIQLARNGADKNELAIASNNIRIADSLNLITVTKILDHDGWMGPQDIGMFASQGLFLVIQHANLATQEKYLPIVEEAEKNGKTFSSNLAILKDRIAVRKGQEQPYGSQGFTDKKTKKNFIYPIMDINNLDKRRAAMGLPPMVEYVPGWNIEKYNTDLPKIKEAIKIMKQ